MPVMADTHRVLVFYSNPAVAVSFSLSLSRSELFLIEISLYLRTCVTIPL